jgi:hypothetical protein
MAMVEENIPGLKPLRPIVQPVVAAGSIAYMLAEFFIRN